MNPDHDDQKKFWKIIILKGVYPILKFEDVQYDFSALESAQGLKLRLKALFWITKTMTLKFFEYSKILVDFGIKFEFHLTKKTLIF